MALLVRVRKMKKKGQPDKVVWQDCQASGRIIKTHCTDD